MTDFKTYFPKNLQFLRKKKNLTQSQLASKVNVDQTTIGRWEDGNREPTVGNASNLAEVFQVSLLDLLDKDLSVEESSNNFNELDEFGILLSSKMKDLPEDKQRLIMNVTKSIIEEVDKELDGE